MLRELFPTRGRHRVHLRSSPIGRYLPLGADESSLLEPVQSRVERSGVHLQHIVRDRLNAKAEIVAVRRLSTKQLEHDEIEGALKERSARQFGHGSRLDVLVISEVSAPIAKSSSATVVRRVAYFPNRQRNQSREAGDGEARGLAARSGGRRAGDVAAGCTHPAPGPRKRRRDG